MEDIWSIPWAKCKRSDNFFWKVFLSRFAKLEKLVALTQALFFSIGRDGARLPVCFTEEASWNAGTSSKRLSTWSTDAALTIATRVGAERFSMTTLEASGNTYHALSFIYSIPHTHSSVSNTR